MATALRTLGRENEDELKIPGTVQLIDLTSTVQRKHSLARKQQDIVLVPTPSDDPDDPVISLPLPQNTSRSLTLTLLSSTSPGGANFSTSPA